MESTFKILSFKQKTGCTDLWTYFPNQKGWCRNVDGQPVTKPYEVNEIIDNPLYSIHSIERIDDAEIFTVGDMVKLTHTRHDAVYPIESIHFDTKGFQKTNLYIKIQGSESTINNFVKVANVMEEEDKSSTVRMKFKDAPIGSRFKYPNTVLETIWVKLNSYPKSRDNDGRGLICSWEGNVIGNQKFCSFVDEKFGVTYETEIELI